MIPAATLMAALLCAQEDGKISDQEKLRADVRSLQEKVAGLERENKDFEAATLSTSRENLRLKSVVVDLKEQVSRLQRELERYSSTGADTPSVAVGPKDPMTGNVISVARDFGIVIVDLQHVGLRDEPKVGYEFDIVRDDKLVALGECVKLLTGKSLPGDEAGKVPKLQIKITRGDWKDVRVGDKAIAKRKIEGPGPGERPGAKAKITGQIGKDKFGIDAGKNQGLAIGDRLLVYRGRDIIGMLRLETVDFEDSMGRLLEVQTKSSVAPTIGDEVRLEKTPLPRREIVASVKLSDASQIIIDVGTDREARPGQKYEVRHQGKKVGTLVIKDAQRDFSYCEPADNTPRSEIQKGDFVELIQD